ncbi:MAG: hypothetical protein JST68_06895 [Bacteroidetes bacterium]|nr:hypothetical protein [Bacteroidota bacterium]
MKHIQYLNAVLTVIAVCLILITLAVTGLLPTASAKEGPRYVSVPLNADGSINVRLTSGNRVDVNISQIRGEDIESRVLPINIKEVDTRPVRNSPLPVATK